MKVFVTGATGVLGRRVIPLLVAAGHEVTAVARTPEKAAAVRDAGATPVEVDLFDASAVRAAVAGHDAVCNLATHIPVLSQAARPSAWAENDRIRTEGVANLLAAAAAGGVSRFIQEGLAFRYTDGGSAWLSEDAPTASAPATASSESAERNVLEWGSAARVAVVLRFGFFYGAGSSQTITQLRAARQGIATVMGSRHAYQPMIHLDDAATAVVAALDAPGGVYNVVEDRPGTREEIAGAIAAAMGVAPLWLPPAAAVLPSMAFLGSSLRVSNRAFRAATSWTPRYPDPRSGWAEVVRSAGFARPAGDDPDRGRRLVVRLSLAYLVIGAAPLALWATFAPKSFFTGFPGAGRHWVAADGPYNHHLTTDVGALYMGLLLITVVGFFSRSRLLVRTVGAAWVVSALPHVWYHLGHPAGLPAGDQIASTGGLGLEVLLGAACVWLAPPSPAVISPEPSLAITEPGVAPGVAPASAT